jgi:hypothetical protein
MTPTHNVPHKVPICIHASAFAAFLGKHPYTKHHEAFEKVWHRASPLTFAAALARHGKCTAQQELERLKTTRPEISRSLETAARVGTLATETTAVTDATTMLAADVDSLGLSTHEAALVKDEIRKELFTHYGTTKEESVIEIVRREMDMDVREDTALHAATFTTPGGTTWKLVGRIDGITVDGSTIIEVKNRMRRLFMTLPEYERIQVESYLRLIGSADRALVIESFRGREEHTTTLNIIPVDRGDDVWAECLARAHVLVDYLTALIADESMQDLYCACSRPNGILRALFDAVRNDPVKKPDGVPA